ncbi:hypothetical protein CSB45_08210 [candidate division KSB3 bacterium]|uniref:LysM domain-containing protein n=1 Tax=candidate division KSB3 bacterium TaxID=2044937 RepID=A0A2G6E5R5_9BACT|nr:MAG: hypothetical protein CSB45_08210 [candidate division KSB3 bacterium]PIE29797.1 MAG: hypothetical protein CSA57_07005 [candidate division KSB3 bacterium]
MLRSSFVKSVYFSLFVGIFIVTGCMPTQNTGGLALTRLIEAENVVVEDDFMWDDELPELNEVISQAEAMYDEGGKFYEERQWTKARDIFEQALEVLLEADVDAATHYRLSQTYDKLFFKLRKLELKQEYLQMLEPETETEGAEEELNTDQLEAFYSSIEVKAQRSPAPAPAPAPAPVNVVEDRGIFQNFGDTLGEISIDPTDSTIRKYVRDLSRTRSQYRKGMERATRYLPMMLEIFREQQLPLELTMLPLIESNYREDAVSSAGAVGLWQFVRTTARRYGLRVDTWVDERRDPEKATRAASQYLSDLYEMLGDWDLALAGYYMGEYKVHKAIGKYRTRNISALAKTRAFGDGAKHYVSRLKAAIILAMDPEQYGMQPLKLRPLRPRLMNYARVPVKRGSNVKTLAKKLGIDYRLLRSLNPELKQTNIPPGKGLYSLRVPPNTDAWNIALVQGTISTANTERPVPRKKSVPAADKKRASDAQKAWTYRIKKGDNLSKISKRYGVDIGTLRELNNVHNVRSLQIGQALKIPEANGPTVITHTVQRRETLAKIAKRYHVDTKTLKRYNNIRNARRLQIGQKIRVPLSSTHVLAKNSQGAQTLHHKVKRGESLSKIAARYGVSVRQLRKWNGIGSGTVLHPGDRIKVRY